MLDLLGTKYDTFLTYYKVSICKVDRLQCEVTLFNEYFCNNLYILELSIMSLPNLRIWWYILHQTCKSLGSGSYRTSYLTFPLWMRHLMIHITKEAWLAMIILYRILRRISFRSGVLLFGWQHTPLLCLCLQQSKENMQSEAKTRACLTGHLLLGWPAQSGLFSGTQRSH